MKRTDYEVQNNVAGDYAQYTMGTGNLLDLDEPVKETASALEQLGEILNLQVPKVDPAQGNFLVESSITACAFISIPSKPVLSPTTQGVDKKVSGLGIQAAVHRVAQEQIQCVLRLEMTNQSAMPIQGFTMKMNQNYLGLQIEQDFPKIVLMPGQSLSVTLRVNCSGPKSDAPA